MSQEAELGRRARKILQAVVSEYLHSGEAIGSRTITRRHDLGLSPATVRNVMADLEELGLLEQRHSSAGRVPTPSGLRFFIDALLKVRGLTPKEKEEIRARLASGGTRRRWSRGPSRMLSELTQHAAVILTPDPARQRFGHLEFVPMRTGKLLAILVTTDGRIENRLIDDPASGEGGAPAARWERIHNYLNEQLSGLTLDEVRERVLRELGDDKHRYDLEVAHALRLGQSVFAEPGAPREAALVVSGQANLVDPLDLDPGQAGRMRELLRTLEDKQTLVQLLDRTRVADSLQVLLGAETTLAALSGSSVVATPYGPDEAAVGALAVIGPLRMNYGKVMSVVDFTAEVVGELLGER
ncbi:MAG: heat-inducible transcriptional repressor HrcA [Kofleriaceae bacterium]